jgi:hypothetical protein
VGEKGTMINIPLKNSCLFVNTCRYLCIGSKNFCNISMYPSWCTSLQMVIWLAETCSRYTLWIIYFHTHTCNFLVLVSYLNAQCTVMDHVKLLFVYWNIEYSFFFIGEGITLERWFVTLLMLELPAFVKQGLKVPTLELI